MKVSELKDAQLDYWVAKAEGIELEVANGGLLHIEIWHGEYELYSPSTDWSQGGPIVEREKMDFNYMGGGEYEAHIHPARIYRGKSMLIAAMRCYVASKFGDTVGDD